MTTVLARHDEIRRRAAAGENLNAIARSIGVARQSVDHVVNHEKFLARQAVRAAVLSGRLVRPGTCERCGAATKVQAHHADYAKPLDVEWICKACHDDEHYGDRAGRRRLVIELAERGVVEADIAREVGISPTRVRQLYGGRLPATNRYRRPGAKTHCPKGHALTDDNVLHDANGKRRCRRCRTEYRACYNALRRARNDETKECAS